jgi:DNA-binding HxlR family transcriptional regulator
MAGKRQYEQFCGLAGALNVIGERWTLLIIRELLISELRFNEIADNLPGIGLNLLSERLRLLMNYGVIEARPVPGDGRGKQYRLTELGRRLHGPVLRLLAWGLHFVSEADAAETRPRWGFAAVLAMIIREQVPQIDESYEFRLGGQVFAILVRDGTVTWKADPEPDPDLVVTGDPDALVKIGARLLSPFEAVAEGRINIEGSPAAVHRFSQMLGLA